MITLRGNFEMTETRMSETFNSNTDKTSDGDKVEKGNEEENNIKTILCGEILESG